MTTGTDQNSVPERSLKQIYGIFGQEQRVGERLIVLRCSAMPMEPEHRERVDGFDNVDNKMLAEG